MLNARLFSKMLPAAAICAVAGLVSIQAHADQEQAAGANPQAAVDLNFEVRIPGFLFFRVGNPAVDDVNTLLFDMTDPGAPPLGNSTAVVGTGGDAGGSTVTVELRSNSGNVAITETNNGGGNGLIGGVAGNFISYAEIGTTAGAGNIPAVTPTDAGGTSQTITAVNGAINLADTWEYQYLNTQIPPADTYTGTVTYTATIAP